MKKPIVSAETDVAAPALEPLGDSPPNAESSAAALQAPITPAEAVFVRSHFDVPRLDRTHRLSLDGAIARPCSLDLAALAALGVRSELVTIECAGNGRTLIVPLPAGEPWRTGAVSTALFTGVPLPRLLAFVGLRDDVVELLFEGADLGFVDEVPGGPIPFSRALATDEALREEVLVAWAMNGAPLPSQHGGPLRLVVPGRYGVDSVKWLRRITALTEPFDGFFQTARYVYDRGSDRAPVPVGRQRVRARITQPIETAARGRVTIAGWAWSGEAEIAAVAISIDGGPWAPAALDAPLGRFAWRGFRFDWEARPGRHTLRARATDAAGHVQPDFAPWNRLGYGGNAIETVIVHVV